MRKLRFEMSRMKAQAAVMPQNHAEARVEPFAMEGAPFRPVSRQRRARPTMGGAVGFHCALAIGRWRATVPAAAYDLHLARLCGRS